jgi:hypothetical protein
LSPAVEQTEMAKLIVVFLNYANAPKNDYFLTQNYVVGLYKGPRLFSLSEERTMVFYVYNLDACQSSRQCHGSRSQPSASHRGCLAILAQFMWNLSWTKWQRDRYLVEYFSFSPSESFHQCSIQIFIFKATLNRRPNGRSLRTFQQK